MKNINFKNLIGGVCVAGILLGTISCNMLSQDPDLSKPVTVAKTVNVSATGSTVIDLTTKIQVAGGAFLAITRQTTKGTLKALGEGLLQYTPSKLNVKTRDNFEYTVYDLNSRVLEQDSIIIIIGGDTTSCINYTRDDYGSLETPNSSVTANVTLNDFFCSFDSSQTVVSIVADSFPAHGTAAIYGNRYITYTGVNNTSLEDKVIYKVQSTLDPSQVMYGVFIITPNIPCITIARDDYYYFTYDSANIGDTLRMRFLDNDVLCWSGHFPAGLTVTKDFDHGVSRMRETLTGVLSYYPDPIAVGVSRNDTLRYEVCWNGSCSSSNVVVTLVRP